MIETVLVLVLLLPVLSMLLYLGRGSMRVQRAQVMDRYESWRMAHHANQIDPRTEWDLDHLGGNPLGPAGDGDRNAMLNDAFFAGHADQLHAAGGRAFPGAASEALQDYAGGSSADARQLADAVFDHLPAGAAARFAVTHNSHARLWRHFDGPIVHGHVRPDTDWRYANGWRAVVVRPPTVMQWGYDQIEQIPAPDGERLHLSNPVNHRTRNIIGDGRRTVLDRPEGYVVWERKGPAATPTDSLRRVFLVDLDSQLSSFAGGGNPIAGAMRRIYTADPGYRGPALDY